MASLLIYEIEKSFIANSNLARALSEKSNLGEEKDSKIIYSIYEVLYLLETKRAELLKANKNVSFEELLKSNKKDKDLKQKYLVFKDLRSKGYILKAGLKFGVDFRCYDKNQKPGKNHAKYLLYIVSEKEKLNLHDFCSKTRVAHSTGKYLLLAVVDSEEDITYFEANWKRP